MRARLDLDGEPVRPLRLEIGGGPLPRPGYVHLDSDPGARHLEHLAPAWLLPLQTSTVDELLAIHVFEHVHPAYLQQTLADWLRVLRPGGVAEIHVPNAAAILPAYLEGDPATKWAAMAAIYGMPCDPARLEPFEDCDLSRRLEAAGWGLAVGPAAVVDHVGNATVLRPGLAPITLRQGLRSRHLYFDKWLGPGRARLVSLVGRAILAGRAVARRLARDRASARRLMSLARYDPRRPLPHEPRR